MIRNAFILTGIALAACSVDPGTDRAGTVAEGIAIDSVRFLPIGSRFVLRDSATQVAFLGYHSGYVCSRFLRLGLEDAPSGAVPAYRPETRVRLPGSDECALDSGSRDTVAPHVFSEGAIIRLANPLGVVTDSATSISGRLEADSMRGVLGADKSLSKGNLTYNDSGSSGSPELHADSVPACRYLNSADWEKSTGDTITIRLTWVTYDPVVYADVCQGPVHPVVSDVHPRRELRMRHPTASR
jgi:hypothetical protein